MTKVVEKIVQYAVAVAQPEQVILFGSLARGQGTVHSDVDLLIIMKHSHGKRDLEAQISAFAKECAMRADILLRTTRELEEAALFPTSFLGSIVIDGHTVYQREKL